MVTDEDLFRAWQHGDVSSAIPRGGSIEIRILAAHQPHPQAFPATPTLEEAYLLFQEGMGHTDPTCRRRCSC